jgi:hypothetical protein
MIDFAFEPSARAVFDGFYQAYPRWRRWMAALLGVSVAGTGGGVALLIAQARPAYWLSAFALAVLALLALAAWALSTCRGSVLASGPGTATADDTGLHVRPASGAPITLEWSALSTWADGDRVITLLPPSGTPLHVIPLDVFPDEAAAFRILLHHHLGAPTPS